MSLLLNICIFLSLTLKCSSFIFHHTRNPVVSEYKSTYSGFSVLLQKDHDINHLIIIFGAPKSRTINGTNYGGQVIKCKINQHGVKIGCKPLFDYNGTKNIWTTNGDFMGAAVDGDDHSEGYVIGCSPRTVVIKTKDKTDPFLYGSCLFRTGYGNGRNYLINPEMFKGGSPKSTRTYVVNNNRYLLYNYAYALFGFDIAMYYNNNYNMMFSGAPRLKMTGGIVQLDLLSFKNNYNVRDVEVAIEPNDYFQQEDSNYLGYSVYVARNEFIEETWFFAGSPRADPDTLIGKVTVYKMGYSKKFQEICTEWGKEFGSYFGSSILASDVNRDGFLDLLVGAPTTAGSSYDEGRVYFYLGLPFDKKYQNKQNTIKLTFFQEQEVRLTGSNNPGARFGTSISSLGDFDLDGFNDVAISAPYENDGKGAVYIYRGGPKGLENEYSQRLVGADDSKGFGLGLSRGNDVDQNGHNDIAIGAYQSDQVFLSKSCGIIEYEATLHSSIKAIKDSTTEFRVVLDLSCSSRSPSLYVPEVQFMVNVWLDYRAKMDVANNTVVLPLGVCRKSINYTIKMKPMKKDYSSFKIELNLNFIDVSNTIVALGPTKIEKNIRYDIGCGNGNVCNTGLLLLTTSTRKTIVLGSDVTDFGLELLVLNDQFADPAYQCEFIIKTPAFILLKNSTCRQEDDGYVCPFREKLDKGGKAKEFYMFVIEDLDLNNLKISIDVLVQSTGKNSKQFSGLDQALVEIPIIVNSTSYIFGKSVPENIALLRTIESDDAEVVHKFIIGKYGPSPLRLNLTLLVPLIKYNGEDLVKIIEIKGAIEGNKADIITCQDSMNDIYLDNKKILEQVYEQLAFYNSTIPVSCDGFNECKQYSCTGILKNSNQNAVVKVKMVFVAKFLAKQFRDELFKSNRTQTQIQIAYFPVLVQQNSLNVTDRLIVPSIFSIIFQPVDYISLWIYLIGSLTGVILLMVVIFALYKCQFFKRKYKRLIIEETRKSERVESENFLAVERHNEDDL